MIMKSALVGLAAFGLAACASIDVAQYSNEKPALDLAQYFTGTVDGWGMFQDRSGTVVKRFYVRIDCTWKGNEGTLDEHFEYTDGTTQNRVWKLTKDGTGTTCSLCRSTARRGTWTWTTGCSLSTTRRCSIARRCRSSASVWAK